jgi:hypothetical protein
VNGFIVVACPEWEHETSLEHIAALSPLARQCWNRASRRTFDIGIQAGMGPRPFEDVQLTPETLLGIASIGGQLQVTVYPPQRA